MIAFLALWFLIAGRLDWIQDWLLLISFPDFVVLVICYHRIAPTLAEKRSSPAENTESWDRILMSIYTGGLIMLLAGAALDSGRFVWSSVPAGFQIIGGCLLISAGAVVWHVMGVNPYLSSWVQIQDDRGQQVVRAGMYSRVRHPMVLGIVLAFVGLPLALASFWAFPLALFIIALFVYRTSREDRVLRERLDGYQASDQVKYRLLPKLW